MKQGILLKKKHEPDTTKFKLLVYYSRKISGEYFTQLEIDDNKNRKYHDSVDFILTNGGVNITRHDEAYNKLINHLNKWQSHIIRAKMYMNDFANNKQYLIGIFEKEYTKLVVPDFKTFDKITYKEKIVFNGLSQTDFEIREKEIQNKEVFAYGLNGPALDTFILRYQKTT